ncbi:MAG: methylenetetrahydrofolate reductase [NAD(P)H] [Pseudomonadota bacterium]
MTQQITISCELFPPKNASGMQKMQSAITALQSRRPAYFSCTYGAGGSTRDNTFTTVDWLLNQSLEVAPHLTCIANTQEDTLRILRRYQAQGIRRIVALRGDRPADSLPVARELVYADELVSLIRAHFADHFYIEVAAYPEMHPESAHLAEDLDHFQRKVEAGADGAITQYFYSVAAYTNFLEACAKRCITVPIVPGIMPIVNYASLQRFSERCGAELPRWLCRQLDSYGDDQASIQAFGADFVAQFCTQLLAAGAPGLHFYTLNQAAPTLAVWDRLAV